MSDTPITERQQHWLDHIQAAENNGGFIRVMAPARPLGMSLVLTVTQANGSLPTNVTELLALVLEQQNKLEQQSLFIDQRLEQIRLARHQRFGTRSERFSIDQMALAFNEAAGRCRRRSRESRSSTRSTRTAASPN